MMKLIKAVRAAYYMRKIERGILEKSYDESMLWINKCIEMGVYNYQVSMMRSFLLISLKRFEEAVVEIKVAVDKGNSSKSLNQDEKNYLKAYAIKLFKLCEYGGMSINYEYLTNFNYDELKIRSNLKAYFPVNKSTKIELN